MGAVQGNVLRRLLVEKEQRQPQLRGVLLLRAATHPLHAGIVGDVFLSFQYCAAFDLPKSGDVIYIIQALSIECVGKRW